MNLRKLIIISTWPLLGLFATSLACATLIGIAGPRLLAPDPGSGLLFAMDYSSGTDPLAGWPNDVAETVRWTATRIAGGGPGGTDVYEIAQAFDPASAPGNVCGGDFYYGWNSGGGALPTLIPGTPVVPTVYGQSRYIRFRLRYSTTTDMNAYALDGGVCETNQALRNKIVIFGDQSGTANSRVILQMDGNPSQGYFYSLQKDGGGDVAPWTAPRFTFPVSTAYQDVQIEINYSSALNVSDGSYKIWVDSNTYASPTAQATAIIVNIPDTANVLLGYMNSGLSNGGTHIFRVGAFQIGTGFNDSWNQ